MGKLPRLMGPISSLICAPIFQMNSVDSPLSECVEHILKTGSYPETARLSTQHLLRCGPYPLARRAM